MSIGEQVKIEEKPKEKNEEEKKSKEKGALDEHEVFEKIFDAVQWGPSAKNQQGWRILYFEKDNAFLFFSQVKGTFYKMLDMGIAMAHFEIAARQYSLSGSWDIANVKKYSDDQCRKLGMDLPSNAHFHFAWLVGVDKVN